MSIRCWLFGHEFEETENWVGNAYDKVKVGVSYWECIHCGKVKRHIDISGKLTKQSAEVICLDNAKEPELIDLTDTIIVEEKGTLTKGKTKKEKKAA